MSEQPVGPSPTQGTGTPSTQETGETKTFARELEKQDFLIKVIGGGIIVTLGGIVLAIALLVFDILRNNEVHERITDLEHQISGYNNNLWETKYLGESNKHDLEALKACFNSGGWRRCF